MILDVVYNHAGGGFDDESLYFLDRADPRGGNNARQFLIDNATFFTCDRGD